MNAKGQNELVRIGRIRKNIKRKMTEKASKNKKNGKGRKIREQKDIEHDREQCDMTE